ncbi:MAG: MFS transporter [Saprospiraceae bacterium]|nr:MFS transporter [Saprospiraceae bacterium]
MKSIRQFILNSYSGIDRNVWILATAMFINRCGSIVMLFLGVYLSKELNYSITQAGVVMSMLGLGSLAGSLLGGILVDRLGYYRVLVSTITISGLVLLVVSQVSNYYLMCLLIFLFTATGDAFRPANITAMTSFSDASNYTRTIALNRLAMNLGFSVAPLIGGFLAAVHFRSIFWVDGLTCIAAGIFLMVHIGRVHREIKKSDLPPIVKDVQNGAGFSSPWKDSFYLWFLLVCFLYATSFFQMFSTLPLYYKDVYHLSPGGIGLLMAMNGLGVALVEMFVIYIIEGKLSQFSFIKIGGVLLVIGYLLMNFFHGYSILVVSMLVITASEILAMPFMASFCMRRAGSLSMGRYMGLYSTAWALALIAAPFLGTQVIDRFGYELHWYVFAAVSACSVILMYLIRNGDGLKV